VLGLEIVDEEIANRKFAYELYVSKLKDITGIKIFEQKTRTKYNYSYFPILIDEKEFGVSREYIYNELKKYDIFTRRYFYPLISNFPSYRTLPSASRNNLPIANKVAEQVLCLPMYGNLDFDQIKEIIDLVINLKDK
jgi:dTDP-4-amino-4,6-dideoxygalactose transaminase